MPKKGQCLDPGFPPMVKEAVSQKKGHHQDQHPLCHEANGDGGMVEGQAKEVVGPSPSRNYEPAVQAPAP